MAYHVTEITKGIIGEWSKVIEEIEEYRDALLQECKIMAIIELSDLYGAIDAYLYNENTNFEEYSSEYIIKYTKTITEVSSFDLIALIYALEHIKIKNEKLAELYVSLDVYLKTHYRLNILDLKTMSLITKRAFDTGSRT